MKPQDPRSTEQVPSSLEDALAEFLAAVDAGDRRAQESVLARHPQHAEELARFAADSERLDRLASASGLRAVDPAQNETGELGRSDDSPLLPTGTRVGGYVVESVLGRGGMGTVYAARHLRLDREVALKILSPAFAHDAERVHRFEREGRALAALEHPNIVRVHDMGVDDERYFIAMERVPGPNLRERLREGVIPPAEALHIARDLLAALEYAHAHGVVHRDVKPENVLLPPNAPPKIVDFGLARLLEGDERDFQTRSQMLIGTRRYMAPEQWRGEAVDHRADLYAMGILLYEMRTGQAPTAAGRKLERPWERVIDKALREAPGERYQSARELLDDLPANGVAPGAAHAPLSNEKTPVIDLANGARCLELSQRKLRIRLPRWALDLSLGLRLHGHDREEFHLSIPGRFDLSPLVEYDEQGSPVVVGADLVLHGWRGTVSVPPGSSVDISCENAEIDVRDLRADLIVHSGKGDVRVERHQGKLDVRRRDRGAILVRGLETDEAKLETLQGRLSVGALVAESGTLECTTQSGALECDLALERCSLRYRAHTEEGVVFVSGVPADAGAQARDVTGRVAEGFAELELYSKEGEVTLRDARSTLPVASAGHLVRWCAMYWPLIVSFFASALVFYTRVPFVARSGIVGPFLAMGCAYVFTWVLFRVLARFS